MSATRIDLPHDDGHVYGLALEGPMEPRVITDLIEFIHARQEEGRKARVYIEFDGPLVFDRGMVSTAKEKLLHMREIWTGIERCAYVMDNDLLEGMIPVIDALTPMDLRIFERDDIDDARAWILAD